MANLTTLETLVRLAVPGANLQVIDSPSLWVYINKGADDVNQRLKVRKANKTFDVVAGQAIYYISQVVPDFLCMDDSGLYWNNGSLWQQLLPKDRKWLDENVYSWRNFINGTPLYYMQENDILMPVPGPSLASTAGFWLYYIQAAVPMSNGNQYPFVGTTTEVPAYRCLDDGIILYCQWKLQALLGNKAQGTMDFPAYLQELEKVEEIFVRRPDMTASRYYKMQGPVSAAGGR